MQSAGRYVIHDEIAAGGMATVHFGRLLGPVGFSRTVAIKCLHPFLARDPQFVEMFLDEARLASRIRHPNVVPTLDVVANDHELFLVMEYVEGESLARLIKASITAGERIAPAIAVSVMNDLLHGLHAAHFTTDARGKSLDVVHRDVSPQNVLVGIDGAARVLDFGVAKALGRVQTTREGQVKGKLGYMAPEQLDGKVSLATDIYAASVVLWEMLTCRRLFFSDEQAPVLKRILTGEIAPPSTVADGIPPALDAIVMRGLSLDPAARFATAREMADALRAALPEASASEVACWVESLAKESIAARRERMTEIESAHSMREMVAAPAAERPGRRGREPGLATGEMLHETSVEPPLEPLAEPRVVTGSAVPVQPVERRASRKTVAIVFGALLAIGVASLLARTRSRDARLDGAPGMTAEVAPVASPSASSPFLALASSTPPLIATPEPSFTAALASSVAVAHAPKRGAGPVVRPPDCTPPYREVVVGQHVRRVPKPECL